MFIDTLSLFFSFSRLEKKNIWNLMIISVWEPSLKIISKVDFSKKIFKSEMFKSSHIQQTRLFRHYFSNCTWLHLFVWNMSAPRVFNYFEFSVSKSLIRKLRAMNLDFKRDDTWCDAYSTWHEWEESFLKYFSSQVSNFPNRKKEDN